MKKKSVLFRGLAAVMAFIMLISVTASNITFKYDSTINKALGISTTVTSNETDANIYWGNEYGYDANALVEVNYDAAAFNVTIAEEGITLLRNENTALPLEDGVQITVFGNAAVNSSIYSVNSNLASGSSADYLTTVTLLSSLEDRFGAENINEILCDEVYAGLGTTSISEVVEADIDDVKERESSWANAYNDVALVVLGRTGSEGNDVYQYSASDTYEDGSARRMLDLSTNEEDLIAYLAEQKNNGVFDKIIVIITSEFQMELGFLEEYDIDAAMLVGTCKWRTPPAGFAEQNGRVA